MYLAALVIAASQLPKHIAQAQPDVLKSLKSHVDWIGAILASASLSMLSYVLAVLIPPKVIHVEAVPLPIQWTAHGILLQGLNVTNFRYCFASMV